MAATQEALYGRIDLALSWSEADLPERERTKHVHRLHPYLGKFVPQLVEALVERYVVLGGHVLDPFAGSGTTLVQSLESGRDATGADVAGFNCLLMRVKTKRHNLDAVRRDLLWAHGRAEAFEADGRVPREATSYVRAWYAPRAAAELLHFRGLVDEVASSDVLRVILARAARSARRTTHFDLDFPREPQVDPYWCHKHRRTCRPVEEARRFLLRYTLDTLDRLETFAAASGPEAHASVRHGDARELDEHRRTALGRRARGVGRQAIEAYVDGVSAVLANAREHLAPEAPVCIVVNDRRDLYPEILRRAGLRLDDRLERHVNRRTGRRAGEYFESILVCSAS